MMKKKQEIIFERKWIFWGVWRLMAYEYPFFFFLFIFLSKQSMKMLRCLSWKCCVFLGTNIDRHENTSIPSSRISTLFLINFSVIFRMSSQTLLSKKQSLNLRTFCAINFLAIQKLSKINYGNTSEIFQSIICLKWQINSTIYANVAF